MPPGLSTTNSQFTHLLYGKNTEGSCQVSRNVVLLAGRAESSPGAPAYQHLLVHLPIWRFSIHSVLEPGCRTSDKNSVRVSFSRKQPTIAEVTVDEFCFSIPRIIMHKCRASITTPTPCGWIASSIESAICRVNRSCTCKRRANTSTSRGILLKPITFPLGM